MDGLRQQIEKEGTSEMKRSMQVTEEEGRGGLRSAAGMTTGDGCNNFVFFWYRLICIFRPKCLKSSGIGWYFEW
jgi:hypothetical protein